MNLTGLAHIMSIEQKPKAKKDKEVLKEESIDRTRAEIQAIKDVREEAGRNYIAPSDEAIAAMSLFMRRHNAMVESRKKAYWDRIGRRMLTPKNFKK